ncbi:MAG TPA: LysR family transcriptional regulator [Steroidobacteraceae bacterium]|jgi:DNA-binding transcriptional LysR family regulator|nr:LysR family transcriptional regulator [Steroidobacteraceae bacterium]
MKNGTQVVHGTEHRALEPGAAINWDDVRLFLKAAEHSSFRAAAAEVRLSVNSFRRRIEALERQVNAVLFNRSAKGVELTAEGEKVRAAGIAMLQQARMLAHMSQKKKPGLRTTVRIGVTEGIGTFWLIPRLVDLYTSKPGIQVDLRCEMRAPDISALEVDLAVQLERPTDPTLVVTRLGWLHIVLYASRDYISQHGAPSKKAELPNHSFIELVAEQIPSEWLQTDATERDTRSFVALRVNTSSAQVLAVTHGAGVTALPNYAHILSDSLVHVAPDFVLKRDIWLAYNQQAAEFPHVRTVIDWMKASFNVARYPWFGSSFLTPDELTEFMKQRNQAGLFAKFIESTPL